MCKAVIMGGVSKSLVNVSHLRVWGFNWDRGIKPTGSMNPTKVSSSLHGYVLR